MISDDEPTVAPQTFSDERLMQTVVAPQTPLTAWAAEAVKFPPGGDGVMLTNAPHPEGDTELPEDADIPEPASDAHNMNWAEACACLHRGQKVRRNGWGSEAEFLIEDSAGVQIVRDGAYWRYPEPDWDTEATDWQVVG